MPTTTTPEETIAAENLTTEEMTRPRSKLMILRESKGWSQNYAARMIGCNSGTYRQWEYGLHKPKSLVVLRKIATAYNISMKEAAELMNIRTRKSKLVAGRVELVSKAGAENILKWISGHKPSITNALYLAKVCGMTFDEFCAKLGV